MLTQDEFNTVNQNRQMLLKKKYYGSLEQGDQHKIEGQRSSEVEHERRLEANLSADERLELEQLTFQVQEYLDELKPRTIPKELEEFLPEEYKS
jgi:hypothetical protein